MGCCDVTAWKMFAVTLCYEIAHESCGITLLLTEMCISFEEVITTNLSKRCMESASIVNGKYGQRAQHKNSKITLEYLTFWIVSFFHSGATTDHPKINIIKPQQAVQLLHRQVYPLQQNSKEGNMMYKHKHANIIDISLIEINSSNNFILLLNNSFWFHI